MNNWEVGRNSNEPRINKDEELKKFQAYQAQYALDAI
jgi:hypothetical protein